MLLVSLALAAAAASSARAADVDCGEDSVSGHFLDQAYPKCTVTQPLDAKAIATIAQQDDHAHLCVSFESDPAPTAAQLRALAKLPWLTCVQVHGVTDLAPLAVLRHLDRLEVSGDLTDLRFLAKLPQLETLSIESDHLQDLRALAGERHLQHLQLVLSDTRDLSPVGALRSLRWLEVYGVSDEAFASLPVDKLGALEVLVASSLSDLRRIAGLSHLRQLAVYDNKHVVDLRPLAGLSALETLELDGTGVADVRPLAKLTRLRELDLSNTAVQDVAALGELHALETLWLSSTAVRDIAVVARLDHLEWLRIDGTHVRDLHPILAIASHLQNLSLPEGVDGGAIYAARPSLRP